MWQGVDAHVFTQSKTPSLLAWLASWAAFGRTAVSIFIVLSGYVLMMPVVLSVERTLRGGIGEFLRRRSRRILPPYYAALFIAVLLAFALHQSVTISDLIAHIFLVQNIWEVWEYSLDTPMWSVALEWQIYFIFALLLFPIWKRAGIFATVATAYALGMVPHYLTHGHFDRSSPWYLGLFALGMMAAEIGFSGEHRFIALRRRLAWLPLSAMFVLSFLGVEYTFMAFNLRYHNRDYRAMTGTWEMDLLAGLATACLIIGCTHHLTDRIEKREPLVLRVLNFRPLVFFGGFSYSFYLVHVLVLEVVEKSVRSLHVTRMMAETLQLVVGVPLALLSSYGFYLIAERPFLSNISRMKGKLP